MIVRQMPVVGGPRHGHIQGCSADGDIPGTMEFDRVVYTRRKICMIMPGRTDRQIFPVLTRDGMSSDIGFAIDAVIQAWARGWSPPWDCSESTSIEWELANLPEEEFLWRMMMFSTAGPRPEA